MIKTTMTHTKTCARKSVIASLKTTHRITAIIIPITRNMIPHGILMYLPDPPRGAAGRFAGGLGGILVDPAGGLFLLPFCSCLLE